MKNLRQNCTIWLFNKFISCYKSRKFLKIQGMKFNESYNIIQIIDFLR